MAVAVQAVPLPSGAIGWSAVGDCGISWSYSLLATGHAHHYLLFINSGTKFIDIP